MECNDNHQRWSNNEPKYRRYSSSGKKKRMLKKSYHVTKQQKHSNGCKPESGLSIRKMLQLPVVTNSYNSEGLAIISLQSEASLEREPSCNRRTNGSCIKWSNYKHDFVIPNIDSVEIKTRLSWSIVDGKI